MEIVVRDADRKKRRDIAKALGKDILRYLAELITNSDDSYRRLESTTLIPNKENPIYIELKEEKRGIKGSVMTVIDNAEGMSLDTLTDTFSEYGADHAGGVSKHARGIFGQGASDVLRAAAAENRTAEIYTFKDGEVSHLVYNMDANLTPKIKIQKPQLRNNQLLELREKLRIPNDGTAISFGVPSSVMFGKKTITELKTSIEKYPSFRYLLNSENRSVYYYYKNSLEKLSSKEYQFDSKQLIKEKSFSFKFDNKKMNCEIKLYNNPQKKYDDTQIIVRDQNYSVFDNTFFGYNLEAALVNVSGELYIEDLYPLCYDHLNAKIPDAIVQDNRTGFDTKNPFYKDLCVAIQPIIKSVIDESAKTNETTDITKNKKFSDALKFINKYLDDELKEEISGGTLRGATPPPEGIKFIRTAVTITKGKTYSLKLLINSEMVPDSEKITISVENEDYIEVAPKEISFKNDEAINGLIEKSITINGLKINDLGVRIHATVDKLEASTIIAVVDQDIHYPLNGLEFFPKKVPFTIGSAHKLNLYVDSNYVPIGSKILLTSQKLSLKENEYEFSEDCLISDDIGLISISVSDGDLDEKYFVEASYGELKTKAEVEFTNSSKEDNLGGGLIAGFRLQASELPYQAYYSPKDCYIYINPSNWINIRMMGEMNHMDSNNPSFSKDQLKYLSDVIATQTAMLLVKRKEVKNGVVNFDNFNDAIDMVQNETQKHKNEVFRGIYQALMPVSKHLS